MFNISDKFAIASCAILLSTVAFSQVGGPVVPPSTTYKWTNESDLIALLDTSTNKILVAQQIIAQCDDPLQPLTAAQRQDGYNIAGHTLYGLHELNDSLVAFENIVSLGATQLDWNDLGDAWRMVGQINRAMGNNSVAFTSYKSSYDTYLASPDPLAGNTLAAYILPFVADSAYRAGLYTDALYYVDEAIMLYDLTQMPKLPEIVELGGDIAMKQGNLALAEQYYLDHQSEYPDYESDNVFFSTPIRIKTKIYKSQGIDIYRDCTPQSVTKAFEIYSNPEYDGMILKYSVAHALVKCLEANGESWSAFDMRKAIVTELDEDLVSTEALNDTSYMTQLKEQQVQALYKAAKMAVDNGGADLLIAQSMLDRIQTEFSGVSSYYQALAADLVHQAAPAP